MPRQKTAQIDINAASEQELASMEMIGPKRAKDLIKYRNQNGPFEDWSDLLNIQGFDEKLVDDIENSGATLGTEAAEEEEEGGGDW